METEVLNILIKAGELVILCLVIWQLARNQGQSNTAVSALAVALGKLSESMEGHGQALVELRQCEDQTQELMVGFRREVQQAHGLQIEAHAVQHDALTAVQQALAMLPDTTADKVSARITKQLNGVRELLETAATNISSACLKLDKLSLSATGELKKRDTGPLPALAGEVASTQAEGDQPRATVEPGVGAGEVPGKVEG